MRIRLEFPEIFLAGLVFSAALSLIAYTCISIHCDYVAEGISVGAFMRIQDGLPYLSSLDEHPIHLNQYSPLYYLFHVPFLMILPRSLRAVVLLGRSTSLLAGLATLRAAYLLGKEIYGRSFGAVPFSICAAFMLTAYPMLWNAVRPDLFSVCLELVGILLFVKSVGSPRSWRRFASAVSCGLAVSFKLNQIGAVTLATAVLLLTENWKSALRFSVNASLAALAALVVSYLWVGDLMVSNMALVLQNTLLSPFDLALNFCKMSQEMFVGFLPLFGAAALGLSLSRTLARPQRLTLLLGLPIFGGLASVGQLKAGASMNYYHDFCILLLVPAAWGTSRAIRYLHENPPQRRIGAALACVVGVVCVTALARRTLYDAVFMRSKNYPYPQVVSFLKRQHPGAKIYTDDSSANNHLRRFAWLGPGHETTFPVTPKLAPTIKRLREEFRLLNPVGAVVATGANCEDWKPGGVFEAELHNMTMLEAKFVRICVFGRANPSAAGP
jgi:uncharacterized membrane protein